MTRKQRVRQFPADELPAGFVDGFSFPPGFLLTYATTTLPPEQGVVVYYATAAQQPLPQNCLSEVPPGTHTTSLFNSATPLVLTNEVEEWVYLCVVPPGAQSATGGRQEDGGNDT